MPKRRQEKQQLFHESLINILYPPPPPIDEEDEDQPLPDKSAQLVLHSDDHQEDHETRSSSSSEEDGVECRADQKLTRAQRKRLRKKKLKENAFQRGKFVGPLVPSINDHAIEGCPTSVRCNTDEELNTSTIQESGCSNSNKLKLRRKAKRQSGKDGKLTKVYM